MKLSDIFEDISTGLMVTDADFKVIWANKFEEQFYGKSVVGLWALECHKEENRQKIADFLAGFKTGKFKTFTKIASGMVINYSSYFKDGEFAGIIRTRINLPEGADAKETAHYPK
jgi:transcriptional regulator with PAS, ATPase and Fis domain